MQSCTSWLNKPAGPGSGPGVAVSTAGTLCRKHGNAGSAAGLDQPGLEHKTEPEESRDHLPLVMPRASRGAAAANRKLPGSCPLHGALPQPPRRIKLLP